MSTIPPDPRAAMAAALVNDAPLKALLALHPVVPGAPAILLDDGSKPPVYPCVTYQWPQNTPDERFRPTAVEGGGSSTIIDSRVEFRCYSKGTVDKRDAIARRVKAAVDGRILTFAQGRIFDISLITELPDQPDPALSATFTLLRFRFRIYFTA